MQDNLENILQPNLQDQSEEIIENSLRPRLLKEYIGQNKVKDSIKIYIEAAKREMKH